MGMHGLRHSTETRKKIGDALRGRKKGPLPQAVREKVSRSLRAKREQLSLAARGRRLSPETRFKISIANRGRRLSREECARRSVRFSGANSSLWKGGLTLENRRIRMSLEYREWRRAVYERDGYRCVIGGDCSGRLNADHIKPFSAFPALRFDVSNGRTLCERHHRETPTFGYKSYKMKYGEQ